MAGIGVNCRPRGLTVAGEHGSVVELLQGEEVGTPRLNGLEGWPGLTNTALRSEVLHGYNMKRRTYFGWETPARLDGWLNDLR